MIYNNLTNIISTCLRWQAAIAIFFLLLPQSRAFGQIIDEILSQDSVHQSGPYGFYYDIGQSFIADISTIRIAGSYFQEADSGGFVRIGIVEDDGFGKPIFSSEVYQSLIWDPSIAGSWRYDSINFGFLQPGRRYHFVVDTYPYGLYAAFSKIGLSDDSTDTGEDAYRFDSVPPLLIPLTGSRMTMHLEGDTCQTSFGNQILPFDSGNVDTLTLCEGMPVTLTADPGIYHLWNTGSTSRTVDTSKAGIFTVQWVDSLGCYGADTLTLRYLPSPKVDLGPDESFCGGAVKSLIGPPAQANYQWSTGDSVFGINADTTGIYWLTVTAGNGCQGTDTISLAFWPVPTVDLGNDTTLCDGTFALFNAGFTFVKYIWSNGDADCCTSVNFGTLLFVIVTDSNNCTTVSDTVAITMVPLPNSPTIAVNGGFLTSSPASSYQWYLDGNALIGATTQSLIPPASGSYSVTIGDQFQCQSGSGLFELLISVDSGNIPEGFSPNGDGMNDFFVIDGVDFFTGATLIVYNRWGTEVFRDEEYNSDWGGTSTDGNSLPDGTYFYLLDLENGEKPIQRVVVIHR